MGRPRKPKYKTSQAQLDSARKYLATLEKFTVRMKPGIKDEWKAKAEAKGISVNQLVIDAVNAYE